MLIWIELVFFVVLICKNVVELRSDGFVEEPEDIETIVGSTIYFRCRTNSLNENEINWCKNDFCTLGKSRDLPHYPRYEIIGQAQRGEHHFKISNVSREDSGYYQCQILARSNRSASLSRKAKLNVFEKPKHLQMEHFDEIVENVSSSVICRCENGNSPLKIEWKVPSTVEILSSNDFVLIHNEYLRETISNLTIRTTRLSTGRFLRCQIQSDLFSSINENRPEIDLKVEGKLFENEQIRIRCEILSNPSWTEIRWFDDENDQELFVNQQNRTEIHLNLTRSMNSKRIFCQTTNSIGRETQSIRLDVFYRPIFIDEFGSILPQNLSIKHFHSGDSIQLKCFVDSNPTVSLFWFHQNEFIGENRSNLLLTNVQHRQIYLCSVENSYFGRYNHSFLLIQNGPPELFTTTKTILTSKFENIRFHCFVWKTNRLDDLVWFRSSRPFVPIENNQKFQLEEILHDDFVDFQLIIRHVDENDRDQFICSAKNSFGSSKIFFEFELRSSFNAFSLRFSLLFVSMIVSLCFIFFVLFKYFLRCRSKNSSSDISSIQIDYRTRNSSNDEHEENPSSSPNEYFLFDESFSSPQNFLDSTSNSTFLSPPNRSKSNRHSTVV